MVYSSGLQMAWPSSRTFGLLAINLTQHVISYEYLPVYRKQVIGLFTTQRQSLSLSESTTHWILDILHVTLKVGHSSVPNHRYCVISLCCVFFLFIGYCKMHYIVLYFGQNILACPRLLKSELLKSSLNIRDYLLLEYHRSYRGLQVSIISCPFWVIKMVWTKMT